MEQTNTINSTIIGKLQQDSQFSDWWNSDDIEIPFLEKKMKIIFMDYEPEKDETFLEEADKAISNFLNLTVFDRLNISELVYKNCMDFLDVVDFDENEKQPFKEITDKNEIWKFIHPQEIYVKRRHRKDKDIYIQIVCNCDWEQEHGLQLIFRQGMKLTRISEQDGHLTKADAFNISDEEDELLSIF